MRSWVAAVALYLLGCFSCCLSRPVSEADPHYGFYPGQSLGYGYGNSLPWIRDGLRGGGGGAFSPGYRGFQRPPSPLFDGRFAPDRQQQQAPPQMWPNQQEGFFQTTPQPPMDVNIGAFTVPPFQQQQPSTPPPLQQLLEQPLQQMPQPPTQFPLQPAQFPQQTPVQFPQHQAQLPQQPEQLAQQPVQFQIQAAQQQPFQHQLQQPQQELIPKQSDFGFGAQSWRGDVPVLSPNRGVDPGRQWIPEPPSPPQSNNFLSAQDTAMAEGAVEEELPHQFSAANPQPANHLPIADFYGETNDHRFRSSMQNRMGGLKTARLVVKKPSKAFDAVPAVPGRPVIPEAEFHSRRLSSSSPLSLFPPRRRTEDNDLVYL